MPQEIDQSELSPHALSNSPERDVEKVHPPGTVALPCGELGRYNAYTYCLAGLTYPDAKCQINMSRGLSIPRNLNNIISSIPDDHEWVWIMGDDHVFDSELLLRLLDREVDVIVPLCMRRGAPFNMVIFREQFENGSYMPFEFDEIPDTGIFEVFAAGTAGMLVRRPVLNAIGYPWFENAGPETPNEDLEFCRKIREAGFKIYADSNNLLGHIGNFTIWPRRDNNGDWGFVFDFGPSAADGAMNQIFINVEGRMRAEREAENGTIS